VARLKIFQNNKTKINDISKYLLLHVFNSLRHPTAHIVLCRHVLFCQLNIVVSFVIVCICIYAVLKTLTTMTAYHGHYHPPHACAYMLQGTCAHAYCTYNAIKRWTNKQLRSYCVQPQVWSCSYFVLYLSSRTYQTH